MPYPQATVHFAGIDDALIQGGEANWNRGVSPSVCLLRMVPVDGALPTECGRLDFRWEGANVVSWQRAAIDWSTLRIDLGEQGPIWSVQIVDRRWEWWQFTITGKYNVPACDGTLENVKSARELVAILLESMGETEYDISDVPANVYPLAIWDEAITPAELQSICDKVNCVVHLIHSTDTVKVSRLGTGDSLPIEHSERIHNTYRVTPHTRPEKIKVSTGPTVFQELIRLEPVGLDVDCTIKPINELSYKPAGGWESQWPQFFADVSQSVRYLAFKSVYRWYRVKDFGAGRGLELASDIVLNNIDEILPLAPRLLHGSVFAPDSGNPGRVVICSEPLLRGSYWPYVDLACNTDPATPDHWDVHLDLASGIVVFDEPVFKIVDKCTAPAEMELLAAFRVCQPNGCWTYSFERTLAGNGKGVFVLRRPYLQRKVILTPCHDGDPSDNLAEIQTEANAYLDLFASRWEDVEARDWMLASIQPIELSGKIAQVKWKCGRMDLSFTRASTYKEFDVYDWTYNQRRRMEFTKQLAHEHYRTEQ